MQEAKVAKEKLIEDFNAVITDSEQLLKAVAAVGGEKAQGMRADLERRLHDARESLARLQEEVVVRGRRVAKHTDEYVHANPWQSIAIGAAIAGIAGLVIGLVVNRR